MDRVLVLEDGGLSVAFGRGESALTCYIFGPDGLVFGCWTGRDRGARPGVFGCLRLWEEGVSWDK